MPDFDVLRINFEQLAKVMAARNNTEDFKIHPKAMSRVLEVKHKQNPSNYLIRCFKSMLNVGYTPPKPKTTYHKKRSKKYY